MELAAQTHLTLAEYNQLEEETNTRYEYHHGEVFAMAGAATDVGNPKHSLIANNAGGLLRSALLSKNCAVFNSDAKYHVASLNKSFYPDVSVVCGPIERSEKDIRALANPILLVEVLSKSTEGYDKGNKFKDYGHLASLQEYVLIEQDQPLVQTFYRSSPDALWQMRWFQPEDDEVVLQSVGVSLKLADLYHKTEGL